MGITLRPLICHGRQAATCSLALHAGPAVSSGRAQMIPFFGPFVSWMPPVLMATSSGRIARVARPDLVAGWSCDDIVQRAHG